MAQNGTILTKRELDRETISTYNLVVTARDCARQPEKRLSSTVQVRSFLCCCCFTFCSEICGQFFTISPMIVETLFFIAVYCYARLVT